MSAQELRRKEQERRTRVKAAEDFQRKMSNLTNDLQFKQPHSDRDFVPENESDNDFGKSNYNNQFKLPQL